MSMIQEHTIAVENSLGLPEYVQLSHPLEVYNASDFTPAPYDPTENVIHQHGFTRLGAFLSGLLGESEDIKSDYIVGVCAAAMIIFGVALLWFMVIVGLKIAGKKRVGFLAGRLEHPDSASIVSQDAATLPVIEEEPASGEIEDRLDSDISTPLIISNNIEQTSRKEKKFNRRVWAVRAVFVLSGLCVIVFSILFYVKGVAQFRESLNSVHGGLELIQQTSYKAINITETVIDDKDRLVQGFSETQEDLGGTFCHGNDQIATTINDYVDEFSSQIQELSKMVNDNLSSFSNDLREVISITEDVDDGLDNADIIFYVALSISIIVLLLIVSMLVVTYFSAKNVTNCCTRVTTNAIIWPVFIFFLVLFWIFSLMGLVTSLSSSDFCVQPDQTTELLLNNYKDQFHSAIFEFLIYYVSGCTIKPAADGELVELSNQVHKVLDTVHGLSEYVQGMSLENLESRCGLDSTAATSLSRGADMLHDASHSVNNALIAVRQMLECKTFNPIYTTFIHDALCTEGVDGLTWIFSSSFAIFMFAMIMITFRAALYPVKRPEGKDLVSGVGTSF